MAFTHEDISRIEQNVPTAIRKRRQWVCWKYVEVSGKPTKVPFNPFTLNMAVTTDPLTWGSFDQVIAVCRRHPDFEGVGYVFTADDPFCGIDLDDCIIDGVIHPEAKAVVSAFATYAEISPSRKGAKLITRATKPKWAQCKKKKVKGCSRVEVYDDKRFFTITGLRLEDAAQQVQNGQTQLDDLCQTLWPAKAPHPPPVEPPAGDIPKIPPPPPPRHRPYPPPPDDRERRCRAYLDKCPDAISGQGGHDVTLRAACECYRFGLDIAVARRVMLWFNLEKTGGEPWTEKELDHKLEAAREKVAAAGEQGMRLKGTGETMSEPLSPSAGDLVQLGHHDPVTGRLVLSPKKTLPTAEAYLAEFHQHHEGRTLHSYAGALLTWRGNRFVEIEEETLRQQIQPWLHEAMRYVLNKQTGVLELVDFESNPGTVKAAVESLRAHVHLPANVTPPAWLSGNSARPDPRELLPCLSGNLHILSGKMLPPTPALFNINALDFDYDPNADSPERWIKFLEQLWGDDLESVELLQEWMGYCLVADTAQQKMLLLVGPKRSGKGTIGRILTRLVGAGNVVGPTTSSLAGTFGLQPLIGKSLAVVSDARFKGENVGVVVERLLCISGEDTLTVDRKFLGSVTMKLPTRFMFLTNELPRMNDASGALAGRFVVLSLMHSFYGQEDVKLTGKLMEELPGILLWAIEGLKRLRARGHFVQPNAVSEAVREMENLASPVLAFVRDCCEIAPVHRVWVDDLYNAWKLWCEQEGRSAISNKQTFGRDLAAAVPGLVRRRGAGDVPFYSGIAIKPI